MKKFLLCALFLVGCSTGGSSPLYSVGACLDLAPEVAAKLNPQQQLMSKMVRMYVSDVGQTMYVVDYKLGGEQLVGRQAAPFADVEKVTKEIDCPK